MASIKLSDLPPRTKWLAAVNLMFVAALLARAVSGTTTEEIIETQARQLSLGDLSFTEPQFAQTLDVIQSQALFHATRTFYIPPPAPAVQERLQPPDYRLVGSIVVPKKPVAALLSHNQSKVRLKAAVGDEIDGWIVEEIDAKRVLMRSGAEQYEINARSVAAAMRSATIASSSGIRPIGNIFTVGASSQAKSGVRLLSSGQAPHPESAAPALSPEDEAARLYRPPPR